MKCRVIVEFEIDDEDFNDLSWPGHGERNPFHQVALAWADKPKSIEVTVEEAK